jgi:hypothetical protein
MFANSFYNLSSLLKYILHNTARKKDEHAKSRLFVPLCANCSAIAELFKQNQNLSTGLLMSERRIYFPEKSDFLETFLESGSQYKSQT